MKCSEGEGVVWVDVDVSFMLLNRKPSNKLTTDFEIALYIHTFTKCEVLMNVCDSIQQVCKLLH